MRTLLAAIFLFAAAGAALASDAPTFSEDVAPIVFENCTSCHRPGQAAPFALETYADVRKRGAFIAAVTASRYMPPWHAGDSDVAFAGDRRLSDKQIATLAKWVAAGMPEGDPAKLPAKPEFIEGWELGQPDLIARMDEPFTVPADGPDLYKYFVLDIPVNKTRWIRALEYRPGTRTVVHHILGFLVPGDKLAGRKGDGFGAVTGDRNRVLTWAVGGNPRVLPADVAVRVEPGMKLLIQIHFHPSGKPEQELSTVGIHFADGPPARQYSEIQVPAAFGQFSGIQAPAGSDTYTLRESFEVPVDVTAFATFAHAHYIGKEFRLTARKPNGETLTILNVPDYDFAWQEYYYFAKPLELPAGTKLDILIRWDNTANNPKNPYNPPRDIKWGLYSEDEMGSIILDVIAKNPADEEKLAAAMEKRTALSSAQFYLSSNGKFFKGRRNTPGPQAKRLAKQVLEPFDLDHDGRFSEAERAAAWEYLREQGYDAGLNRGRSDD